MSDVEQIVRQIVNTASPGNDLKLIESIERVIDGESDKLVERVLRDKYTQEDAKIVLVNGKESIVSPWNRDGIKFIGDGIKFGYDFIRDEAIDIEEYSIVNESLQDELNKYIEEFYTNGTGIVVGGGNDETTVVIVGEKLNDANYYNGRWVGVYRVNGSKLEFDIHVKIHYYEDGNVVLNSRYTQISEVGSNIIKSIEEIELDTEVKILNKVTQLNEEKFKNLRRLMPVSRSRIQWGRSIGNYKLGKEAANV
ncbi:hypothetical protein CANINC_002220 [Pichia inconspicua]|uniref:F-actin-capping protein subunit alpha n=1 Tax=Pichia inconspicua TaxID=52247 RepID=A0A4V4NFS7_9ASCO|nr:hypothetical protein CANINC_002220 [[Candida] inconspicua]